MKATHVTVFILGALAVAVFASPDNARSSSKPDDDRWEAYKTKFRQGNHGLKMWEAKDEASKRATYLKNVATFDKFNAHSTSKVGDGPFAHMTEEEFSAYVGLSGIRGQPLPATDATSVKTDAPKAVVQTSKVTKTVTTQPAAFDWRNASTTVVLPVGNQGQCGSCWAGSASSTIYACQAIKGSSTAALPSTQQLVDCSDSYGNSGCAGGWAHKAYNYVKGNKGVNIAANYPYTGVDTACDTTKARVKIMTISSYVTLPVNNPVSMMSAILINPLVVTLRASEYIFQHYTGGIISNATACGTAYDHQMMAVGYNTDVTTGLDYWICKNTWGTSWGDAGYVYIQRSSVNEIGMCGINQYTVYPTC